MGRGAHAAHAAYNGSGTQGLSVTDKINKNEEIKSVFITENDTTKQIIHGCNISEMKCSGKSENIDSERYKIFTPDENSDMIGDIYLNFEMDSDIPEFTFVDESSSNAEYDMNSFTEESRLLDLKLVGNELKSLDVNLNTNQIPSVIGHQNLGVLGFEVINQTKFIKINEIVYQFIVGKAKPAANGNSGNNLAWRDYSSNSWTTRNVEVFEEIKCLILETQHQGSGSLTGITGIIVFGGIPSSTLPASTRHALLYTDLSDFPFSGPNVGSNVFKPFQDFPSNSSGNSYYEAVYTLEYYGSGKIIVSGSKDHTNEYFRRGGTEKISYSPDGFMQTCLIITSDISSTTPTYQKAPFTNEVPFLPYSFDPIVSSSFSSPTDADENLISIGGKSESLIFGIDSNRKLIRSYDNGKKWTLAPFYHGDGIPQNSTPLLAEFETGRIPNKDELLITSRGTDYVADETLNVKSVVERGTGARIRITAITPSSEDPDVGGIATAEVVNNVFPPWLVGTNYSVGDQLEVGGTAIIGAIPDVTYISGTPKQGGSGGLVTVTSINADGGIEGIALEAGGGGSGFRVGEIYNVTSFDTVGDGASIVVGTVTASGGIATIKEVSNVGSGFKAGDTLVVSGGSGTGAVLARKPYVYTTASVVADHRDDFYYYIPQLDYVISNNIGGWYAIGKQGKQPDEYSNGNPRPSVDKYRQFVFYSDNDGFEWHPVRFSTYFWTVYAAPTGPKLHYEENVEYLEPHLLTPYGRVEIPFKVSGETEDSQGNESQYSLIVPIHIDAVSPVPPAVSVAKSIATWPITPGPYVFPEIASNAIFDYEYIGASNNRKRQIYFGYQTSSSRGVITCRQGNGAAPSRTRVIGTRTALFSGIYPRSIKYAYRDVFIGVFSNTSGDPDGSTTYNYQFKESTDGLTWNDIKINNSDTISSTKDPLIEGDKYGNFIVAVFGNNNKYNLYRNNSNSLNFEILFDDTFNITDVFSINFVSNEWQIALEITSTEYLIKSYDLTKWLETEHNVAGGSKVRKISYKHERVNPVIYRTNSVDNPYESSGVIAYNILYNPEDGAGVRPFRGEGLATYQGSEWAGSSVVYLNVNDTSESRRNKEPNDIIHVNDKVFIASNKQSYIADSSNFFPFPLVESVGNSTVYKESETIYGSAVTGTAVKVPVSSFADNLRRLYSSPRDPEIIFTMGDFIISPLEKYGVILYRFPETRETYELAATDGGYYWRVLMGPPKSSFDSSAYASQINQHTWMETVFENITDVAMSKTSTQMVVVGKGKQTSFTPAGYKPNLVIFPNGYEYDFKEYIPQQLDFDIIYTVCNLGNLWVVGGKPSQSDGWHNQGLSAFNNKCVAYTFDLENWKYIDFTNGASVPNVTMPGTNGIANNPIFITDSQGTESEATDPINFQADDIKPLDVDGQTGILLQISFVHQLDLSVDILQRPFRSGNVAEKIYFMYVSGEKLIIKQNNTYPEPSDSSFRQNAKQLVPSFTTIVNNIERRFVATWFPTQFNLFYVVYRNNQFQLTSYSDNNLIPSTTSTQRFRKLIYIDENSIIKRSNGHCYKIAKVKNENFVTGVNSARYVAVGKGNFSNILWSDDLILWNDTDTTGIFDIAFDVTHKHGIWVAVGAGNHQVAISKDGKKWTGIYPKYTNNSPEIITEGVSFNALEYPPEEIFGVQAEAARVTNGGNVLLPDGSVSILTVTNGGAGYRRAPVVTIRDAVSRTATGTTLISNGSVIFAYIPPNHDWMNADGTVSEDLAEYSPYVITIEPPTNDNIADVLPYIPNLKGIFLRNLSILRLFSRIEYHVGSQIWQTLTFDDIKAMLDTEFGSGEYAKLLKNCSIINKNGSTKLTTWIPGFTKTLNSKLETFANISENGSFPSGLLKDQKLSIKVYYNNLENVIGVDDEGFAHLTSSNMNNAVFDNFMNNTLIPCDRDPNYFIDSFLADNYGYNFGTDYQNINGYFKLKFSTEIQRLRLYCKQFEMDDTEINELNKGVKQVPKITQSLYFDADNVGNLLLDLDNFNLYASHIIVSGWLTSDVCITDMNLELNGYSYNKTIEPSVIDFTTNLCLGLNYNTYTFNGVNKEDGIGSLIIPLASTAYSGSSVPLDRYSSIRLRINFNAIAGPYSYINVTCVGTTTVSYNNNTANIDLY